LNLFFDAVNQVNNPPEVQAFLRNFRETDENGIGRLRFLMLEKKAARYHQRLSQKILYPYQITMYLLLAMAIDDVVFMFGVEQELKESRMIGSFRQVSMIRS